MGSEDPARRQQIDAEAVGIDAQPAKRLSTLLWRAQAMVLHR
jgi:hypothetical protein